MFISKAKELNLGIVIWSLSLIILIPIMLFIMAIIRPILKRHYEPKWITKWYKKTDNKWFS